MPRTFLHAADIHLDSPLRGLDRYENAPADRIRNASRRAFTRLIDLAIAGRVDFVLIAGDLYDGNCPDFRAAQFLNEHFRRLRDAAIPVVIISGNHDAQNKMTRVLAPPENVRRLASDRAETLVLDGLDVAIHGQSFARAAVTENLVSAYPAALPHLLNVGLLHTALAGAEGHEPYAPCTPDDLDRKGYDYWALGHIHRRHEPVAGLPAGFPGNIQGRHIRETGEKGCLLVTEASGRLTTEFHRLDVVRWERAQADLDDVSTESAMLDRVAGALDEAIAREPDPDRLLAVRLVLRGATPLDGRLGGEAEKYLAEIRDLARDRGGDRIWLEKVEVRTRPAAAFVVPDGPIEALREVLEQLHENPADLRAELADLWRKLPDELKPAVDGPGDGEPDWFRERLDEARAVLSGLLQTAGREAAP